MTSNPVEKTMLGVFKQLMIEGVNDERIAFTAGFTEGMSHLIGLLQQAHPGLDQETTFHLHKLKIMLAAAAADTVSAFDDPMRNFARENMDKLYRHHGKPPDHGLFSPADETSPDVDS